MTPLEAAALWAGTFANVFLLGFQSRNVHAGRYAAAAVTSVLIGASQLLFVRVAVDGDPLAVMAVVGTAGPAGICTAIAVSQRLFDRRRKP